MQRNQFEVRFWLGGYEPAHQKLSRKQIYIHGKQELETLSCAAGVTGHTDCSVVVRHFRGSHPCKLQKFQPLLALRKLSATSSRIIAKCQIIRCIFFKLHLRVWWLVGGGSDAVTDWSKNQAKRCAVCECINIHLDLSCHQTAPTIIYLDMEGTKGWVSKRSTSNQHIPQNKKTEEVWADVRSAPLSQSHWYEPHLKTAALRTPPSLLPVRRRSQRAPCPHLPLLLVQRSSGRTPGRPEREGGPVCLLSERKTSQWFIQLISSIFSTIQEHVCVKCPTHVWNGIWGKLWLCLIFVVILKILIIVALTSACECCHF